MVRIILAFVTLASVAGCAPMTPRESLGQGGESMERLANATTFIAPPPIDSARGYEIALPQEVAKEIVCREFTTLDKQRVEICRKAFRARVGGQNVSLYPQGEKGYVFVATPISSVQIFSARGVAFTVPVSRELSAFELRGLYATLGGEFPLISGEIPETGKRLLFGEETLHAIQIPSLVSWQERGAICGLGSISSSDILGPVMLGPVGLLPKVYQVVCTARQKPQLLTQ